VDVVHSLIQKEDAKTPPRLVLSTLAGECMVLSFIEDAEEKKPLFL
jgi:hypothetical protein